MDKGIYSVASRFKKCSDERRDIQAYADNVDPNAQSAVFCAHIYGVYPHIKPLTIRCGTPIVITPASEVFSFCFVLNGIY